MQRSSVISRSARIKTACNIGGKDWTNGFTVAPSAVVFPETIEQLQELVRYAISAGVKLVPSGGRTGLSGGAVASNGEVVVSFDRMNKILDFSEQDRIVTCQPGLITANLQDFAEQQGLFYPVDFASSGSSWSQIGGNVSTQCGRHQSHSLWPHSGLDCGSKSCDRNRCRIRLQCGPGKKTPRATTFAI